MPAEGNTPISEMDRFYVKKAAEDYCLAEVEHMGKFEYSISALIFGSLALSLQFSLNFGNLFIGLIIYSWIQYLVSGCIAGYRIYLHKKYMCNTLEFAKSNVLNLTGDRQYLPHDCLTRNKAIMNKMNLLFLKQIIFYIEALFFNFLFLTANLLLRSGYKIHSIRAETILIILGILIGMFALIYNKKEKEK